VIKINATGQEYCLPCADDIEGVIVERGGVCVICKAEREDESADTVWAQFQRQERESEQVICGDCLRPDCYHLEQVRGRV
jgi:hypothetical protein